MFEYDDESWFDHEAEAIAAMLKAEEADADYDFDCDGSDDFAYDFFDLCEALEQDGGLDGLEPIVWVGDRLVVRDEDGVWFTVGLCFHPAQLGSYDCPPEDAYVEVTD